MHNISGLYIILWALHTIELGWSFLSCRLELFVLSMKRFCYLHRYYSFLSCTDEMPISQHFVKLTQASLSLFLLCIYVCTVYVELVCAQVNSNNNQHSSPLATDELG